MSIPEGATHVVADIKSLRDEQKVMNNKYPYRKKDGDLWLAFVDDEWVNVWLPDSARYQKINKPWSGPEDGLPPVGIECEYNPMVPTAFMPTYLKWSKVRIVTHDVQMGDTYAVFSGLSGYCGNRRPECFRPIKTPEQLAAELRETAIRELMDIAQVDCRVTAARLVDAGFKREVV